MFKQTLIENYATAAITTSQGVTYTNGMLLRQTKAFTQLFEVLRVDKHDTVGIYCKDEGLIVSTVMACMCHGTNFTILDRNDEHGNAFVRASFSGAFQGLILSDVILEDHSLTINPETFEVISKSAGYYALENDYKDARNSLYEALKNIKNIELSRNPENGYINDFNINEHYLSTQSEYVMGVAFHVGLSQEIFNASLISHSSIYKGIEKAVKEYKTLLPKGNVICLEPIDLMYDFINGVLAPILSGRKVIIVNKNYIGSMLDFLKQKNRIAVVYTSTVKFEKMIGVLEEEIIPLLKKKLFKPLYNFAMRRKFRKHVSSEISHVIMHGKIRRHALLNSINIKYTVLYTMNEVASFVAINTFKKIPESLNLRVPDIRDIVISSKDESTIGEILVFTEDMFDRYLTKSHTKSKFFDHPFKGRFYTGDIGYMKNGELHVIDKARNIFVNENGIAIETGNIITLALRFDIVKEANVLRKDNGFLTLLVEPNFEYAEVNKLSPEEVKFEIAKLKSFINKHLNKYSHLDEVAIYSDPAGLMRKNYKIISRHF